MSVQILSRKKKKKEQIDQWHFEAKFAVLHEFYHVRYEKTR